MTTDDERRARVRNGSRRKRDLAVAGPDDRAAAAAADIAAKRSADSYHDAVAWAERALPDEHAPFAASAMMTIRMGGHKPTAANVKARLKEQGRDRASLRRLEEKFG